VGVVTAPPLLAMAPFTWPLPVTTSVPPEFTVMVPLTVPRTPSNQRGRPDTAAQ